MNPIPVDGAGDERLGDFAALNDPALRRRREQGEGFFVAEGVWVIRHLLASAYRVRALLVTPRCLDALRCDLEGTDAPVYVADQAVMAEVAGFNFHRGALASAWRSPAPAPAAIIARADLLVVAEGVNDHENLGALFRNAAAFGAGGVLLDPTCADPLYRRAVRVSMGHVLRVPFARVASTATGIADLRAAGFEVLALTPAPAADDVRSVARRPRQALLVGAEGPGLAAGSQAAADRRVRIAMAPGVDSLNVATAAAVALHHLARW